MYLATSGLFRARWTNKIHEEWISNVLKARPDLSADSLAETRRLMNLHMEGALVTGYEDLIPSLVLPDPNDRHILAAAIRGRADLIVTYNLKDFPSTILDSYGIEAQHPDEFISHLFDLEPYTVLTAVERQIQKLQNPPVSTAEFLMFLKQLQMPKTANHLQSLITVGK